jgi:hypothetical protein
MMEEQPKAKGGGDSGSNQYGSYVATGVSETPVPTLASQGIDKNLPRCAWASINN